MAVVLGTPVRDGLSAGGRGDLVVAGRGDDFVVAGAGADTFVFSPGDGQDWIQGFTPGVDTLQFAGGLTPGGISVQATTLLGVPGLAVFYNPGTFELAFLANVTALGPNDLTFQSLPPVYFAPHAGNTNGDAFADILLQTPFGTLVNWMMVGATVGGATILGDPPAGSTTPPFNLDHVVVGPAGIFAIETKTRRKGRARVGFMAHEIIYDGRALSYPWGEDRYGLDQALRQAEWLCTHLERQLGRTVPVYPLLVFPGWMIIRKAAGAVNVLNPRELPAAIMPSGSLTPALDSATIDLIARQLEARCRDVEL
jgi:hypothetical protein